MKEDNSNGSGSKTANTPKNASGLVIREGLNGEVSIMKDSFEKQGSSDK